MSHCYYVGPSNTEPSQPGDCVELDSQDLPSEKDDGGPRGSLVMSTTASPTQSQQLLFDESQVNDTHIKIEDQVENDSFDDFIASTIDTALGDDSGAQYSRGHSENTNDKTVNSGSKTNMAGNDSTVPLENPRTTHDQITQTKETAKLELGINASGGSLAKSDVQNEVLDEELKAVTTTLTPDESDSQPTSQQRSSENTKEFENVETVKLPAPLPMDAGNLSGSALVVSTPCGNDETASLAKLNGGEAEKDAGSGCHFDEVASDLSSAGPEIVLGMLPNWFFLLRYTI